MKPIIPVMRTALQQIQELHSKNVPTAIACGECHDRFPCPTRKLADEGLVGGERG